MFLVFSFTCKTFGLSFWSFFRSLIDWNIAGSFKKSNKMKNTTNFFRKRNLAGRLHFRMDTVKLRISQRSCQYFTWPGVRVHVTHIRAKQRRGLTPIYFCVHACLSLWSNRLKYNILMRFYDIIIQFCLFFVNTTHLTDAFLHFMTFKQECGRLCLKGSSVRLRIIFLMFSVFSLFEIEDLYSLFFFCEPVACVFFPSIAPWTR